MDQKREKGVGFFGEVLGDERATGMRQHITSDDFGKECATWAADFAFGTVWTREGLERPLRSCAVMGMLIALRQTDELKYHVRVALANGLTVKQIEEVLYLSIPYAGFPAANSAKHAIIEALQEIQNETSVTEETIK
jgi:alkylhydroperoxidase/carboxymuconolactone decarboxylase family protein YurZ